MNHKELTGIAVRPKVVPEYAVFLDPAYPHRILKSVAKWCKGSYDLESVWVPNAGRALLGSYVLKNSDGSFTVQTAEDFHGDYLLAKSPLVHPCYPEESAAVWHKSITAYADLYGYARCSPRGRPIKLNRSREYRSDQMPVESLCLSCFGLDV